MDIITTVLNDIIENIENNHKIYDNKYKFNILEQENKKKRKLIDNLNNEVKKLELEINENVNKIQKFCAHNYEHNCWETIICYGERTSYECIKCGFWTRRRPY